MQYNANHDSKLKTYAYKVTGQLNIDYIQKDPPKITWLHQNEAKIQSFPHATNTLYASLAENIHHYLKFWRRHMNFFSFFLLQPQFQLFQSAGCPVPETSPQREWLSSFLPEAARTQGGFHSAWGWGGRNETSEKGLKVMDRGRSRGQEMYCSV